MILYFPNDILNCFTGEILYTKGTQLTDQIVLNLMYHGIDRYEVSIHKPAEDRDPPKTNPLVTEDLGLEVNPI